MMGRRSSWALTSASGYLAISKNCSRRRWSRRGTPVLTDSSSTRRRALPPLSILPCRVRNRCTSEMLPALVEMKEIRDDSLSRYQLACTGRAMAPSRTMRGRIDLCMRASFGMSLTAQRLRPDSIGHTDRGRVPPQAGKNPAGLAGDGCKATRGCGVVGVSICLT
ncbi:hypothetical protein D9M71_551680 [compost metagenome]